MNTGNMVLAMDAANRVSQPRMAAMLVVTSMACCTDDIDCLTMDLTVALDMFAETMDVSVASQLWLRSALILALKMCVFLGAATIRRMSKSAYHNNLHRRQSNCKRNAASVRLLPRQPIERVQMPVTFEHTMILMRPLQNLDDRIVCIQLDICRLGEVSVGNRCRMDHDKPLNRCHCFLAISFDWHNSSMDSLKLPSALRDAVMTLMRWLSSNPLDTVGRVRKHRKTVERPTMPMWLLTLSYLFLGS